MPNKKKLIPGSIQANKFIAELPENREKIKASIQKDAIRKGCEYPIPPWGGPNYVLNCLKTEH